MIPKEITDLVNKRREEYPRRLEEKIRERRRRAREEAGRLVSEFQKIDPNLGRIVLFGSLAADNPGRISQSALNFDIDLSFEGDEYYQCVDIALKSEFKVDLVDYRSAAAHIKDAIDTAGKVLYDPNT